MRIPQSCRLIAWGFAAPLLMFGTADAQDGKQPVGPPTTTPATNKLRDNADTFDPPTVGSEVLTPVPATASDPAPPGTRAERVDLNGNAGRPNRAPSNQMAGIPGANPRATLPAGTEAAEGLITGDLARPGKDLPGEQIRFTMEPARNWADYAAKSPKSNTDAKDAPKPVSVVVTRKTKIYTYARTPAGRIVADGSNPYNPTTTNARSAANVRMPMVSMTNFTNLKPEQYVAVQYRTAGNLNEATSVAIIVPASDAAIAAAAAAPAAGSGAANNDLPKVRVPRVPATPAAPSIGN